MTNHPRQREMWNGLTGSGCLGIVLLLAMITIILEFCLNV